MAALYAYYPVPKEAFEAIVQVPTEALSAVRSGHKEEAIRQIQQGGLLTRKLQVGVFIRTGRMDPEVTKVTKGLDFYSRLVGELVAAGIAPFATLYHWDL